MAKLTKAQQREYDILKQYGYCIITERTRNKVYKKLVEKGVAFVNSKGHNKDCYFSISPIN